VPREHGDIQLGIGLGQMPQRLLNIRVNARAAITALPVQELRANGDTSQG
jgi:hypothetical protein